MEQFNLKSVTLLIVVILTSAGTGFYFSTGNKEIKIQEKIVYKEAETKIEYRDRTVIKERIVYPDGTIIEKEIAKDVDKSTDKKTVENDKSKDTTSKPVLAKYSLGLQYYVQYSELLNLPNYSDPRNWNAVLGYRMLGPIWIEAGAGLKELTLGVRVEL